MECVNRPTQRNNLSISGGAIDNEDRIGVDQQLPYSWGAVSATFRNELLYAAQDDTVAAVRGVGGDIGGRRTILIDGNSVDSRQPPPSMSAVVAGTATTVGLHTSSNRLDEQASKDITDPIIKLLSDHACSCIV